MSLRKFSAVGICLVFWLGVIVPAKAIVVIANASVAVDTLTISQLRRIYAIRYHHWPDNQQIHVFSYSSEQSIFQQFCQQKIAIFPYQLEKVWDKLLFSGMGVPPITVFSEQEMLNAVSKTPGAIGYLSEMPASTLDNIIAIEVINE